LTQEQERILTEATGPVEVRNSEGRLLAACTPLTPHDLEMIEKAKKSLARGGPGIPSARVQAMLQKLHELDRTEGTDPTRIEEVVRKVISGESL
jgi:hypothetical protein